MNKKYYEYIESNRKTEFEREMMLQKRAEYEYIRNKKNTLIGIFLTIIGIAIVLTKELLLNYIDNRYSIVFVIVGAIAFSLGSGLLLFRYLQNGSFSRINTSSHSEQNLRSQLQDLRVEILKLRKN